MFRMVINDEDIYYQVRRVVISMMRKMDEAAGIAHRAMLALTIVAYPN